MLILGEALLVGMAVMIKDLKEDYPEPNIVFFRNMFGFLAVLPFVYFQKVSLKTKEIKSHLIRTTVGLIGMYGFFYVITHMSLAESSLVKLSVPLFLPIVGFLFLREKINRYHLLAILMGFLGVVFIARPKEFQINPVVFIAIAAALFQSGAKVAIRSMKESEPPLRVVFYFALFSSIITFFPATLSWKSPDLFGFFKMLLMGLFGTAGQIFITEAYQVASPGKIGAFSYSTLIFSTLLGCFLFDESLQLTTYIGFALIVLAGLINLYKGKG